MSHATHLSLISNRLTLEGLTLAAVESGRVTMDASDYLEIAQAATSELRTMSTPELRLIALRLPPALLDLVENILFDRIASERQTLIMTAQELSDTAISATIGHASKRF